MAINLSFETLGDSVPMQLKFKRSVNSLWTYYFMVTFLVSFKLILININLTGNSEPEVAITLCAVFVSSYRFKTCWTSVVKQFNISSPI